MWLPPTTVRNDRRTAGWRTRKAAITA